ncbi:MAG: hypothetical protein ACO3EY_03785 [Candidatus Nanopelagicales bacterium]
MKTFARFFNEAVETQASTEAKNRGLVGNGHGDWYDKQGNFVAKTVKGKLKFFGQGDTVSKDGVPGEEIKKSPKTQQTTSAPEQEAQPQVNGVAIVVGRFNPPSKNHEALLRVGMSQAKRRGFEYRIYPSRIQDYTTNPLNPSTKIAYMQALFSDYAEYIVDDEEAKTIFDILASVYGNGYTDVVVVVGQDRLGEFQSLVHKGEGQNYQFNSIEVVPSGVKDPDSEVETPGSSALMRAAAAVDDFDKFVMGLPSGANPDDAAALFDEVKKSLQVTEDTEVWRIEPMLDYNALRWNYKNEGLYEVDTMVENLNTGLVGKIIRRGANYLICVTESGFMFKSWLKDVREVFEIGTTEYIQHAQEMTPGQPVVSFTDIIVKRTIPQFMPKILNNNRKRLSKVK